LPKQWILCYVNATLPFRIKLQKIKLLISC
jgi:hypothetical protein